MTNPSLDDVRSAVDRVEKDLASSRIDHKINFTNPNQSEKDIELICFAYLKQAKRVEELEEENKRLAEILYSDSAEMKGDCYTLTPNEEKIKELETKILALQSSQGKGVSVEEIREFLPDALAESQVETIKNSAIYDVDINKMAILIHDLLKNRGER